MSHLLGSPLLRRSGADHKRQSEKQKQERYSTLYFSSLSHLDPILRGSFSLFLGYAWNEPFVRFSTPERITKVRVRNRNKSDDYLLYFSSISHLVPIIRGSFSLFLGYAWNEPFVRFSTPERITNSAHFIFEEGFFIFRRRKLVS